MELKCHAVELDRFRWYAEAVGTYMILLLAAFLIAATCGVARAESLVEAAEKQKEAAKQLQESGKKVRSFVITRGSVPAGEGQVSVLGQERRPIVSEPASERAGGGADLKAKTQVVDTRADTLRREIERLQADVDALDGVNSHHVEYSWKKSRLERLKGELSALEERARKEGIPPGALR